MDGFKMCIIKTPTDIFLVKQPRLVLQWQYCYPTNEIDVMIQNFG